MKSRPIDEYLKLDYELIIRRVSKYEKPFFEVTTRELDASMFYGVGVTIASAVDDFESAKLAGFSDLLEMGIDIPRPLLSRRDLPSGRLVVRFPPSLHAKLAKVAKADDQSLNSLICLICAGYATTLSWMPLAKKEMKKISTAIIAESRQAWSTDNITDIARPYEQREAQGGH